MPSMPIIKSSISSEDAANIKIAVEDDNFKWLLTHILADIHQDGGQYTTLAGLEASVADALCLLMEMRSELRALRRSLPKSKRAL